MKKIGVGLLAFISITLQAQEDRSTALFATLKTRDSLIFNVGFNQCNMGPYDTLISDDIEFYHDRGGVEYGKTVFIESVRTNICGQKNKLFRELVDSSLQVFPMYKEGILYGAIQQGDHRFYVMEGQARKYAGEAKFVHLWIIEQNHWHLKRVLSYYHHSSPTAR
ncbi:nuclear transport factor 2 family protein [Niabella insulamsoli]|uniref:nuclear transport factor 2 family protein n=1 Tax=Niabella insulamsoli TaxID=3144874 RepID=UPI0031FBCA8C